MLCNLSEETNKEQRSDSELQNDLATLYIQIQKKTKIQKKTHLYTYI
jgi:hypothetical protein